MNKKIISLLMGLGVLIFVIYFFLPKNKTVCGSMVPISCLICKCSKGVIYNANSFGGYNIKCLGGEFLGCENE